MTRSEGTDPLDGAALRADFPLLSPDAERPAVYLDSAATSQKPESVLAAMDDYYRHHNANVHRGAYGLAAAATDAMEHARRAVALFIGAAGPSEIVFTKNATEALNLVVGSWGRSHLGPGDAVLLTEMEHHANIVPWQILAAQIGFEIRWVPLTPDGHLDLTDIDRLLDGVKMFSVTAASNVLGTLTPIGDLVAAARRAGAAICVDACQWVPHAPTDVGAIGADFLAFSGHKMCGPTGVGVLWAREQTLEDLPPFLGGGGMIADVTTDGFTCADVPWKFEAGTPPIAEIVGLGAAVDYLGTVGMAAVREHEHRLTAYALRTLTERFGEDLRIHGPSEPGERAGVMSFSYRDLHPHDIAQVLDQNGVCVRAGHHCAKPLMRSLGVGATTRASWYLYNTESDIDALADGLAATSDLFF